VKEERKGKVEAVPQLHEQRTSDGKKKTGQDFAETIREGRREGGEKERKAEEGGRGGV
jgi:hypothetical protein